MRRYPTVVTQHQSDILNLRKSYTKFHGKCPTCRDTGTYQYMGETHECEKDEDGVCIQIKLLRFYELANIPQTYQRLNWSTDFVGQPSIREDVQAYIDNIENCLTEGVGMTFYSKTLGTGKTFCATHILKEVVKKRRDKGFYTGYYIGFYELIGLYQIPEGEEIMSRLLDADLIVIDDIEKGRSSEKQNDFYSASLERVIRKRMENSTPTLITTNLLPNELKESYNRIFSLLADRNMPQELKSDDTRISRGVEPRIERAFRNEMPPIT